MTRNGVIEISADAPKVSQPKCSTKIKRNFDYKQNKVSLKIYLEVKI
ncbi:hypothetical protein HMPREF9129_1835 [Peptoniphilus indolicus ATCC 29427]|uniref:Uncharacterized protein n=1 Tax=Peptoniphilus indolicus ATCC 29427 TaxID=997350 RepID=G4D605_9FIRM|nr:hypothetical protein HMPREF9129_1835 [Peptoniphilus indolicus ATCC 29427]